MRELGFPRDYYPFICLVFKYSFFKKFLLKKVTTETIENTDLLQNVPPPFLAIKKIQIKAALR